MAPSLPLSLVILYTLIGIYTTRKVTWLAYNDDDQNYKNGERTAPASMGENLGMGFCAGIFWPITAAIAAVCYVDQQFPNFWHRVAMAEPSRARKQRQLDASRERTAALEKELEIA